MFFEILSHSVDHVQLAYLDPASGSLIIQAVIASVVGVVFFMRTTIRRVVDAIFHRGAQPAADDLDTTDSDEA